MKTMKNFLSMAALALMGAMMTGCSNDDNFDNPQQPENKSNVVTLTTTVGLGGSNGTRALDASGHKTFAVGDKIAVLYGSGRTGKWAVSEALKAEDITNGGKSARFTVTLEDPDKSDVTYVYPASMVNMEVQGGSPNYEALATQDGTLDYVSNHDLCDFTGAWDGKNLPEGTLTNWFAILAVTMKNSDGSGDITSSITSLNISDGSNNYHVEREAAAGPIYVAIHPTASANIKIYASDGSKYYNKNLTKTYQAGNGYSVSWKMQKLELGYVFCSDGSVYADASAATTAGKTPVAKIAYLGNDAETSPTNTAFKNGLALALEDVSDRKTWCSQRGATCLAHYPDGTEKGDMAGIANTDALVNHTGHTHAAASAARGYNSGIHPAGTSAWFLPSAGQWDKMITAAGDYETLKTNAGLQNNGAYWSSTELSAEYAWYFSDYLDDWCYRLKHSEARVRACLAF